jgi:serine/threonine protein kinase KIN1/2
MLTRFAHDSVATTSTKPAAVIKADIRRVLDRMQVRYRETKTGYECIHLPSIDLSSVQHPPAKAAATSRRRHRKEGSVSSAETGGARSIVRKASKLSFGMKGRDADAASTATAPTVKEKEKDGVAKPAAEGGAGLNGTGGQHHQPLTPTPSSGSSSFFNVPTAPIAVAAAAHPSPVAVAVATEGAAGSPTNGHAELTPTPTPRSASPEHQKNLPAIPRDFAASPQPTFRTTTPTPAIPTGEVDQGVFDTIGTNSMAVRFDINVVKVRAVSRRRTSCASC